MSNFKALYAAFFVKYKLSSVERAPLTTFDGQQNSGGGWVSCKYEFEFCVYFSSPPLKKEFLSPILVDVCYIKLLTLHKFCFNFDC